MFRCGHLLFCKVHLLQHTRFFKTKEVPSALVVIANGVYSPLRPHIDESKFKDVHSLHMMMKQRDASLKRLDDFVMMKSNIEKYNIVHKNLLDWGTELEEKLTSRKRIPKEDPALKQKRNELTQEIDLLIKRLKEVRKEFNELIEKCILPYLKLPNILHPRTGSENGLVLTKRDIPAFNFIPKSHREIGESLDELEFMDVPMNTVYLKNKLSILELAVGKFAQNFMQNSDYILWSNTDFAKAVTVEGCGMDVKSDVFEIENKKCVATNHHLYLVGGASLPSFISLFCKRLVVPDAKLPIKYFTVGRNYKLTAPQDEKMHNLFNCNQSNCVSSLIAYPYSDETSDLIFNDLSNLLVDFYSQFSVHFTVIKYSVSKLKPNESIAFGFFMYSSSLKDYVEVGRISLLGKYVSHRLQCWKSVSKNKASNLGFVYAEIININKFIGCLMENTQTREISYKIPLCLKPHMFGLEAEYF